MRGPRGVVRRAALATSGLAVVGSARLAASAEAGDVRAVLLRHARAPGTGDPPGFRLGDCATQRNLSPEGRAQAEAVGRAMRSRGLVPDEVRSSRWCRAWDTARLLGFGEPMPLDALDSIFETAGAARATADALRAFVAAIPPGRLVAMVTHQVNVTALTGVLPLDGEGVLLGPDARAAGRLPPPPVGGGSPPR